MRYENGEAWLVLSDHIEGLSEATDVAGVCDRQGSIIDSCVLQLGGGEEAVGAESVRGGGTVVVGAAMVGANAGEVIQGWCLPIARGMKIKHMAGLILPYPTLGEVNKRAAGSYFTPQFFSDRTRWIVRLLARLG